MKFYILHNERYGCVLGGFRYVDCARETLNRGKSLGIKMATDTVILEVEAKLGQLDWSDLKDPVMVPEVKPKRKKTKAVGRV